MVDLLKSPIDMLSEAGESLPKVDEVLPKVDKVLPQGIETCRGAITEIAEFAAELADVTIGGPSKYPCGRGVMLASLHSSRQIAHLLLERRDAWLEITRLHYASLQLIADKEPTCFQPGREREAKVVITAQSQPGILFREQTHFSRARDMTTR